MHGLKKIVWLLSFLGFLIWPVQEIKEWVITVDPVYAEYHFKYTSIEDIKECGDHIMPEPGVSCWMVPNA